MRIQYICHSCIYIETGDTKLVIDPWVKGSAYRNQWFLFPKPVDYSMLANAKNILYSHGHEDHLHEESLEVLPHDAQVFYPYQWRTGIKKFFDTQNFKNLTEAVSFHPYKISPSTTITYIGFALESVIVIECNGFTIVNINDALNSHHDMVVQMFLKEIKKRFPKIDLLLSGWSGAGYFPNMVHYPGKDDFEIGKMREQYFGNQLCKFIKYLEPKAVAPFAPGFALLSPDKRWINDVKFPRGILEEYYRENYDGKTETQFHLLYPGDYFEGSEFHAVSPYYPQLQDGSLNHTIAEVYKEEIEDVQKINYAGDESLKLLTEKLNYYLNANCDLYHHDVLKEANFTIHLKDVLQNVFINVRFEKSKFIAERSAVQSENSILIVHTTSELLHYSLDNEWGGDALTIGYGIDVNVLLESTLEKNLDIVCVRLLTRYPRASKQLVKHPFRALKYYLTNPMLGSLAIKQKLNLKSYVNKFPYNERDHWITYTKCELCKVCDMPLLSWELGESLVV